MHDVDACHGCEDSVECEHGILTVPIGLNVQVEPAGHADAPVGCGGRVERRGHAFQDRAGSWTRKNAEGHAV
jgi:hypothetical protein